MLFQVGIPTPAKHGILLSFKNLEIACNFTIYLSAFIFYFYFFLF